jgi:hypothetical protein
LEKLINITCILDACTVINLIHIDEDEFLMQKLQKLDIHVCEKVFDEINKNIRVKENKMDFSSSEEKEAFIKNLGIQVAHIRSKKVLHENYLDENIEDKVKTITTYSKPNGEFYSTVLAFHLSSFEEKKVYFITDDGPAHDEFKEIFQFHQIGNIEDSTDLLMLLYRLNADFRKVELLNFFSKLKAEYAFDVRNLLVKVKTFRNETVPTKYLRDNNFKSNINKIEKALDDYNFSEFIKIKEDICMKRASYKDFIEILEHYPSINELATKTENSLFQKTKNYTTALEKQDIYRI